MIGMMVPGRVKTRISSLPRVGGWLICLGIACCLCAHAKPVVLGYEWTQQEPGVDLTRAGLLLLGELGCANCHEADRDAQSLFDTRTSPRLSGVGSRLNGGYLKLFLSDPQGTKPGTTMPRQLRDHEGREREHAINALTRFLLSSTDDVSENNLPEGDGHRGQSLYHRVGCVACHEPDASYRPARWRSDLISAQSILASAPLGNLSGKYRPGRLARFLLDPLHSRPSARMPRIPLTETEAVDLEEYLAGNSSNSSPSPKLGRQTAEEGEDLFSEMGCASCHEMVVDGTRLPSSLRVKPLSELRDGTTRGCLADSPPPAAPDFGLSDGQRNALREAIAVLAPARREKDTRQSLLQRRLAVLNCLACHVRDGVGGPEIGRASYFEAVGEHDLGDASRFPPALTGVGRKLTVDALRRSIRGDDRIRPYLATRMPDYDAAHASTLAELFEQVDLTDDIVPVERTGRNRYGRHLVGQAGLACVGCHDLLGYKSSGIGAIDLAHAPKRLRVEWFRDFLIDPSQFSPRTRMPSFWPGGEAVNKEVLRGNTKRQIDSLWVYLIELDQTRLPVGLEDKEVFELKPVDRPMVFRTFMTGVGMHAVAVGFPEGIHAAFDSRQIRWAQAWRGRFLDAESTWDDRFTPLTPALSDDLVMLPPGPPFAILADGASPWPVADGIPPGYRFGGFRLDESGAPVFLYEFAGIRFEDRVTPSHDGRSLRREVRLRGSSQDLWFRAGVGERIETLSDGSYWIDQRLRIRLENVDPSVRRSHSGTGASHMESRQELVAPMSGSDGEIVLVQEMTW